MSRLAVFRLGRRLEEAERRALGVGVEGLVDAGCRSAAVRQDQLWSEPDSAFALEERHDSQHGQHRAIRIHEMVLEQVKKMGNKNPS
jgi:hypothetical protein